VIGKLRNSQNEKLGCDCERKSEKIKAKKSRKLVKQRVMKTTMKNQWEDLRR